MTNREQLIEALVQLEPTSLEDVVNAAYRRRDGGEVEARPMPDAGATREEFARWIAGRHLATDAATDRVISLPSAAPEDEILLLEVNRFLHPPDPDVVERLDFTPDTTPPFKVLVADVTADQWDRIAQSPGDLLPPGWVLEGPLIFGRSEACR